MIKIVSDTSTMYNTKEAEELGFSVSPLYVTVDQKGYRELEDIQTERFIELINQGNIPTSSQPAIGDVHRLYEEYFEDEIINICMAHGLSGTYQSAVAAAKMSDNSEHIHVINSRTLCGPHRYMVENAVKMVKEGHPVEAIIHKTEELMDTARSFLIPSDFAYLRRGGRLSPVVSYVGQATKFAPVMTQTDNGEQLIVARVCRNFKTAIEFVSDKLIKAGVGEGWKVYITHGGVEELADKAKDILTSKIPNAVYEKLILTPAFVTQGGPGCVAVQYIKMA